MIVGSETYSYDGLDRITRYQASGGAGSRYLCDGAGERLMEIPTPALPADYAWNWRDGEGRIATEWRAGGVGGPVLRAVEVPGAGKATKLAPQGARSAFAGQKTVVLGRFGRHIGALRRLADSVGGRILDKRVTNADRYIRENLRRADTVVIRTTNVRPGSYTLEREVPWVIKYNRPVIFVGPKNKYIDAAFGWSVT